MSSEFFLCICGVDVYQQVLCVIHNGLANKFFDVTVYQQFFVCGIAVYQQVLCVWPGCLLARFFAFCVAVYQQVVRVSRS